MINLQNKKRKIRDQWGDNNSGWKGDNAGYAAKHNRIKRDFGEPQQCEGCGLDKQPSWAKRSYFEWANISGKYLRERSDWKRLCISCHRKYDKETRSRGEGRPEAKLKNTDIPLIRELLKNSHLSRGRIGVIFKVSCSTIDNIFHGRAWRHIL